MAHVEKSYAAIAARHRSSRSRAGTVLTDVLSMLMLAVLAGGLIGVVVYESVRLVLGALY